MGSPLPVLPQLCFPSYQPLLRPEGNGWAIYDPVRRMYVALTPEEWVRQSLLNYLLGYRGYPAGLMAVERLVEVNRQPQRADVVAYSRRAIPYLLVGCKAPSVPIDRAVLEQAARYNAVLRARYFAVTNGLVSHIFAVEGAAPRHLGAEWPAYE